jgi:hypothetical protein
VTRARGNVQCEDCGDDCERRTRCVHCKLLVCRWCFHHVHSCEPNHSRAECRDIAKAEPPRVRQLDFKEVFSCPECQRISHNPNDLENRYCGNCHRFFAK